MWYAILGMTLYMIAGTIYTFRTGGMLDSTITVEWFGAMRWVVGLGGTITVAQLVKNKPNKDQSDDDDDCSDGF